jgi:hypothetical protein
VTLLSDSSLRARLGRQAREAVLARYRTAHSVGGYREFYERLAQPAEAPPTALVAA